MVVMLQNRFKEFRRDRKPKQAPVVVASKPPVKQKSPAKELMNRPEIADGEDQASYERFCSKITEEFQRKKPRPEVYDSLIELTYPHRRQEILDTSMLVSEILVKHPFLKEENQVNFCVENLHNFFITFLTVVE